MKKRYWFIYYMWRGPSSNDLWEHHNDIIEEHPLDWLREQLRAYPRDKHVLMFFRETSATQFKKALRG